MYYVLSHERDEWGSMYYFKRGKYYKQLESAKRMASNYHEALVMKYGKTIPVWSTNPKLRKLLT